VVADHAAIFSGITEEVLGSAMFGRMSNPLPKAARTRTLTTDVSIGDRSKSQGIDFVAPIHKSSYPVPYGYPPQPDEANNLIPIIV
jgi:hypothetical protein